MAGQWSEWKVERLRELVGTGMSASEVGKELGISKNSVIGKAERIGLKLMRHRPPQPRKPTPPMTKPPPPPRPRPPPRRPRPPDQPDVLTNHFDGDTGAFALFAVPASGCLWPIGDPANPDFRYCGAKREHPHPYCAEHAKVAFQPTKPRIR